MHPHQQTRIYLGEVTNGLRRSNWNANNLHCGYGLLHTTAPPFCPGLAEAATGPRPARDGADAIRDGIRERVDGSDWTRAVYLCVGGVQMARQSVALDQRNDVNGVQHK